MTAHDSATTTPRRNFLASLLAAAGWYRFAPQSDMYALVLGTAQDGGMPQTGCYTPRCEAARRDPRYVASMALIQPGAGRYYLVDATPDLTRQLDLIPGAAFRRRAQERRPFDGIFLTHAHIGHYLGVALLGREGLGISRTPCYCSPDMAEYLSTNGPWSLLVDEGRLYFPAVTVDEWHRVDYSLSVKLIPVPHRHEFSDTVAFVFRGPTRSLLYVPDIDRWEDWQVGVEELVREVDVAFLDGSFYSPSEVPGRNIEDIPHPLIPNSMDLLQRAVDDGNRVVFTHLNNTNPAHDESSAAARDIATWGFEVARAGMRVGL